MSKNEIDFPPYNKFKKDIKLVENFEKLSILAYSLTLQLLFRHPKEELSEFVIPDLNDKEKWSYSPGDMQIKDIVLTSQWITLEEYSRRVEEDLDIIIQKASLGELGPQAEHPDTREKIVIWPPGYSKLSIDELPEPGVAEIQVNATVDPKQSFNFKVEDLDQFDTVQKTILRLAHSVGNPNEANDRAREILYRVCLLLRWTIFEIFLRNTIHELFRRHPNIIVSKREAKKPSLSYENIMELSENFTSIQSLYTKLVEREIEQSESEDHSVHGLINLLKDSFKFARDPYKTWYILNGKRFDVGYTTLLEIKEIRNVLMHKDGLVDSDLILRFPNLPHRENMIFLDDEYNTKSLLIMKSIAFNIARLIQDENYEK